MKLTPVTAVEIQFRFNLTNAPGDTDLHFVACVCYLISPIYESFFFFFLLFVNSHLGRMDP